MIYILELPNWKVLSCRRMNITRCSSVSAMTEMCLILQPVAHGEIKLKENKTAGDRGFISADRRQFLPRDAL